MRTTLVLTVYVILISPVFSVDLANQSFQGMISPMTPLTIIIVLFATLSLGALALPCRRTLLRLSGLRMAFGGLLVFATAFCGYGALAAGELTGPESILWRTGYLLLGAWTLLGSLFLFLHHPHSRQAG